jgi:hypothetical protein
MPPKSGLPAGSIFIRQPSFDINAMAALSSAEPVGAPET